MVGKVLKVDDRVATVRIGREDKICLTCQGDCARAKGEPVVEVKTVPGLRVGQVVRLRDWRVTFWWLKGVVFLLAFVSVATMSGALEKMGIVIGLLAGGAAWLMAHHFLRRKRRYAITNVIPLQRSSV